MTPPVGSDDEALVIKAPAAPANGVASAEVACWLAAEVLPHEGAARRWLRRAGASPSTADDVIQEAYSRIIRTPNWSKISSGRAYLFVCVRNTYVEQIRRQQVVPIDFRDSIECLEHPEDVPGPDRIVAARDDFTRVARLIATLPVRARRVLWLRRVDGLSQRDVAHKLGITENVVEKQLALALRRLLKLMAHDVRSL
jgi:RNA polymerase sigma-70 factor (ECF subfamily)